jgi:hypothetical protein
MSAVLKQPTATVGEACFLSSINPDRLETINAVFHDAVGRYGDNPAFTGLGVTLSYRRLEQYSPARAPSRG